MNTGWEALGNGVLIGMAIASVLVFLFWITDTWTGVVVAYVLAIALSTLSCFAWMLSNGWTPT